jgi:hypothetical protein
MILAGFMIYLGHIEKLAKQKQQAILNQKLDAAYVKGFEAALDCRAMLSAPMCEMILQKAGKR